MKTFRELCDNKPSVAIKAMCDGLIKQSKRKRFVIDMNTFGAIFYTSTGLVCFGCAATCAVQQLAKKNFTPKNDSLPYTADRARFLKVKEEDLIEFELVIDHLRLGSGGLQLKSLFRYFRLENPFGRKGSKTRTIALDNENWRENLGPYRELAEELEQMGY